MNDQARSPGFGEQLSRMQDALLDPAGDLSLARQKFLRGNRRRLRLRTPALVAAWVAALVAVASLVVMMWPAPALTFHVDDVEARADLGAPITAPASRDAVLRFSDGSTFALRPHSRARATALSADGASILLERGAGLASVVKSDSTRWQFHAGAFKVLVTGTKFDLAFRPEDELLSVRMHEGTVVVTGCSLPSGIGVTAGQALEVRCVDDQAEVVLKPVSRMDERPNPLVEPAIEPKPEAIVKPQPEPEVTSGPETEEPARATAVAAKPTSHSRARPPTTSTRPATRPPQPLADDECPPEAGPSEPSWRELAAKGRYREAYEASVALGYGTQCNGLPAADLLILADAAMFSGHIDDAKMALTATRRRFAGTDAAATAAFMLGRIAFDHQRAYGEARRWFTVYLSERPSGRLAREAMGRLIEVEHRVGNAEAARALSRRYVERHPKGPHEQLARSLLSD